ncbi:hypothetical protein COLO4_35717 [Corchorus olitorius]|uniref:F-box domain-containing protein n=1 Tax=Corchorus olitorius TaxID=93759 RepID=A0A1R3GDV9_9ROSI|nr:hypothetical protein COLO4_35717 [Corchorus olitorius]
MSERPPFIHFPGLSSSTRGESMELESPVPETQNLHQDSQPFIDSFQHSSSTRGENMEEFGSPGGPYTQELLQESQPFLHFLGLSSSARSGESMEFESPVVKTQSPLKDSSVDNISWLPDEILSHILSFLHTKAVVRTSILSKMWKHVWTLAPNIDFNDHSGPWTPAPEFSLFKSHVDGVLFHHVGPIKKCFLNCATMHSAPYIYAWISAVLSCKVEEFTVYSSYSGIKELPWNLFTCKTLVSLKLMGGFVLDLPYYVCFPCLKKLHLDSLIYVDDSSMKRLFAGCHVLEELHIKRVRGDCVLIANISVPSLKRLYLVVIYLEHVADHEYKTNINAPCLEYLEISDSSSIDYSVNFSASLVQAKIRDSPMLVRGIANVQILKLYGEAVESWNSSSRSTEWPRFNKLFHLELGGLLARKYDSGNEGLQFHGFKWIPPDSVPECLLETLQTIRIHNLVGRKCEIFLVRYMLKHAQVLQEMTIDWRYDVKWGKKTSVQRQILSTSRCSEDCEIEFI